MQRRNRGGELGGWLLLLALAAGLGLLLWAAMRSIVQ